MQSKIATEFMHNGKHVFRKMEVAKICNFQDDNIISKCKKVCQKNATVYAAVEITEKATNKSYVTAKIFRTMTQLKVNNYFFWDEISENENPDETDCPSSILKLLTPTENPKALLWRSRCKDNLAELAAEKLYQDSLTNLPLYTKIRLLTPDSKGNDIILIKDDDPAFKSPVWIDDTNGKKYKKVDIQNAGFEIISKG